MSGGVIRQEVSEVVMVITCTLAVSGCSDLVMTGCGGVQVSSGGDGSGRCSSDE